MVNGLRKVGLDAADITYVIVSHGHGDHYGGARDLQQNYGATVLLSAPDWELMLGESAWKFAEVAEAAGADVIISNHDRFDDAHLKIAALADRKPGDPHPYVIGPDATLAYLEVAEQCALAGLAHLTQ